MYACVWKPPYAKKTKRSIVVAINNTICLGWSERAVVTECHLKEWFKQPQACCDVSRARDVSFELPVVNFPVFPSSFATVWSKISVCVSNSSSCVAAIFSACCAIAHAISQLALTRDFSCRALGKMWCGEAGQFSMLTKRSSSWWEFGFLKTGVSPYTTELLWSWTCGSEIGPKILRHPHVVAQICSMLRKTSFPAA